MKLIEELIKERKDVVLVFKTIGAAKLHAKRFREAATAAEVIWRKRAYDFELINGSTVEFVTTQDNATGEDVRDGYAAMALEVKNG